MRVRERRRDGFTLVEVLIVIVIIALISAIAIPSFLRARMSSDEAAAIGTLRTIGAAEVLFRSNRHVNRNGNEEGEFGFFAEMTGKVLPRGNASFVPQPYLPGAFRNVSGGVVTRSGYVYRVILVGAGGAPAPESLTGGEDPAAPPDDLLAEALWVCYAWPSVIGSTGDRAFVITNNGDILWQQNTVTRYSGLTNPPSPDAVFSVKNDLRSAVAIGQPANDGETWYPVR